MNAKQRKQAEKIAAYAASLADNRLLAAQAAETSAAIERQRLEAVRETINIPEATKANLESVALMRTEQDALMRGRTIRGMETDLYNARAVFDSEKAQHERLVERDKAGISIELSKLSFQQSVLKTDLLALEAKKTYLDAMTKPSIEVIKDILVCLELEESPLEIAARLRKIHGILEPKW